MLISKALTLAILGALVIGDGPGTVEPGGDDTSTALALANPDEYAWRVFLFVNRQAKLGVAGESDQSKAAVTQYDPDRDVVWETWALSSGFDCPQPRAPCTNPSEVFKDHGAMPVDWSQLPRGPGSNPKILSPDFKNSPLIAQNLQVPPRPTEKELNFQLLIPPEGSPTDKDESRMNRSTYQTVRDKGLYSVEGAERAATAALAQGQTSLVTFERTSKEVKARWVHLLSCDVNPNCADKKRYHWRTVRLGAKAEVWGLASLHIITKDLPNWFWADFGHIDCEKPVGTACDGAGKPPETPLRDRTTSTSNGVRAETRGSKWENYRLRGTQTEFTTATGVPTTLSNPVIEATFQTSSCMTCHSYASVGLSPVAPDRGTSLPRFAGRVGIRSAGSQSDDIGKSDCRRFYGPNGKPLDVISCPGTDVDTRTTKPLYVQTDFLWSIVFRALSETQ